MPLEITLIIMAKNGHLLLQLETPNNSLKYWANTNSVINEDEV